MPLFSELRASSTAQTAVDSGTTPAPPPPASPPPEPEAPAPPACESESCRLCQSEERCVSPEACHPETGQCARLCDPAHEDPLFSGACPEGSVCAPGRSLCVECSTSEDCSGQGQGQICELGRNVCVECVSDGDCPNSTIPVCASDNTCVQCVENSDCTPAAPFCTNKACFECRVDSDCQGPLRTTCYIRIGSCQQCDPDRPQLDCAPGSECRFEDDEPGEGFHCED